MWQILWIKSCTKSHTLINLVYLNNSNDNKKFHSLTYIGKLSEKPKSTLTNAGFNIFLKTNNTLGKHLKNNKLIKFVNSTNPTFTN